MITERMQDAINEQINKEMFSEYLYLSMAAYFESLNLPGFANFFYVQIQEERFHAMKFYHYLKDRGGRIVLKQLDQPQVDFDSPLHAFEEGLKHEQFVTQRINNLMDVAIELRDHATKSLLNFYVDEQVEEEATFETVVNKLRMIDGKGHGLLMLDAELASRTFTAPAVG